jgi:hypothetical protein
MKTQPTRYAEIGYRQEGPGLWRFVSTETDQSIGEHYRSKAELLADLRAYAVGYGCAVETEPDLLEAAKAILEFSDNGSPVHPGSEVISELRAAIAKAEGKTP